MNLNHYPYIPKDIVLRRYQNVNIYDLKHDESFIIDEEAFSLLQLIDGKIDGITIVNQYQKTKQEEVNEILYQFNDLDLVKFSQNRIEDSAEIYTDHIDLPQKNPFDPPYLKNLMINITEKCNLSCKHCYITDKNKIDMPLKELMDIIQEFYNVQGIRLILTGGEPFLYTELKDLLKKLTNIPLQKVMLTNGVLIRKQDNEIIELLKQNNFEIFVSLDGLEEAHNDFRNADCFKEIIQGIKRLLKSDISVSINTMIHKQNLDDFDGMLKLIRSLGKIKNWSIDIPTIDESTPKEIREKYEPSPEKGGEILKNYGWGVIYESDPEGEQFDYACGPFLMAIDVIGKITKCGFFTDQSPGNIFDLGLKKAWRLVQKDLNWNIKDLECANLGCEYLEQCRGGCRYRAYKSSGNIYGIDPYKCVQFGQKIKSK